MGFFWRSEFVKNACKLSVFAAPIIAVGILSSVSHAESLLIVSMEGEWRTAGQHCAGFKKGEPFLDFEYDGNEYVSFGKLRCKLNYVEDSWFEVADKESCEKKGFPDRFIGKYSLAYDRGVDGHLEFKNTKGEVEILKDCRVHK